MKFSVVFSIVSVFNCPVFMLVYTLYISRRALRIFGRQGELILLSNPCASMSLVS